ncbi:hypothetical protein M378DRAFT_9710 [Amanita muscaria Koide BX008]|uniref:Uncharacterized protein n=1 Tax=Amanita muscaria (strain Koide BX008) TaxID=946122 RepID=A0A0C2XDY4_AMAMK|nr:hypothetical protein M378DRAFT_9710 [Amanita muscaria Koide BX008]
MQSTDQPKIERPLPPTPETSAGTDTGEAQSTRTATGETETTKPSAKQPGVGVSVGQKIKGAAHIIHGAGEEFRGSVLGAFDTMRGRDVSKTEAGQISGKGKEEIRKGREVLKPAKTGAAPAAEAQGGETGVPPQREGTAAAGTGPGKDVSRAEEAETKTGAAPGQYQAPYGVRDNQSAPGNVAASQAEGQGIGQQTREGGPLASEHGPPPYTTAQQS